MSVAIIVPGMVRTWKSNYQSLLSNTVHLDKSVHLTMFDMTRGRNDHSTGNLTSFNSDEVSRAYAATTTRIMSTEGQLKMSSDIAKQLISKHKTDRSQTFVANSVVSQAYSWQEGIKDVPAGAEYVLKTRFDLLHYDKVIIDPVDDKTVVCANVEGPGGPKSRIGTPFEDMCFYGRKNTVLMIMSEIMTALRDGELIDHGKDTIIFEFIMGDILKRHGVSWKYGSFHTKVIR